MCQICLKLKKKTSQYFICINYFSLYFTLELVLMLGFLNSSWFTKSRSWDHETFILRNNDHGMKKTAHKVTKILE